MEVMPTGTRIGVTTAVAGPPATPTDTTRDRAATGASRRVANDTVTSNRACSYQDRAEQNDRYRPPCPRLGGVALLEGSGLLTDRYELTMLSSWLADGTAGRA